MNFTLHQLKVFIAIVEKKSITKAAIMMNMTQPAASIQLRNLQDQFDMPLTEVIGRQLYVTDFGMEMYRIAQNILNEVEAVSHRTLDFKGMLSGKLRMATVSTGKYVLPYFLQQFLSENPNIELQLDVTNKRKVIESLEENLIDFAMVSVLPSQLDVEEELLLPNKLVLVGAANDKQIKTLKNDKSLFASLPLIFREDGSGTRYTMQQYFSKAHIAPKIKLELTSNEAVKQAVIAGLGYSILSVVSLRNELKNKDVRIIPVKGLPLHAHWRLIWLKQKKFSYVAGAYLNFVRLAKTTIQQQKFSWMERY